MIASNDSFRNATLTARESAPFELNYVRHVEPRRILRSTPRRLRSRLRETLRPAPTPVPASPIDTRLAVVIGRFAEAELLFAFRLRQAASGQHRAAEALHADGWSLPPVVADVDEAVAMFTRLRRWNLRFIDAASRAAVPGDAVNYIAEAMAHHDIARLDELASLT